MTPLSLTRLSLVGALFVSTSAAMIGMAEARTYTAEEFVNRDRCYEAVRMPAIVEYNTRGIHVSDATRSWVGNPQVDGSLVISDYDDPVYIQTRRIVDDQHVTLVPTAC